MSMHPYNCKEQTFSGTRRCSSCAHTLQHTLTARRHPQLRVPFLGGVGDGRSQSVYGLQAKVLVRPKSLKRRIRPIRDNGPSRLAQPKTDNKQQSH